MTTSISLWVEFVWSPRWPWIRVGRVYKRRPAAHAGVITHVVFKVPRDLLNGPTISIEVPAPEPVTAEARSS